MRGILSSMPEKLDDEQLKAGTRLAKLASGENRIEALREQTRPVWKEARGALDSAGLDEAVKAAVEEAARAIREGRQPDGQHEQRVVEGWIATSTQAMGRGMTRASTSGCSLTMSGPTTHAWSATSDRSPRQGGGSTISVAPERRSG